MDAAGKNHAEKAIDGMKDRGQTNLSGGLLAALQQFYNIPVGEASLVESVLLFTDGKANVGITDTPTIERATRYKNFHHFLLNNVIFVFPTLCSGHFISFAVCLMGNVRFV